ncbi:hypothetical protein trd_0393 [Thermomicrobium roseum DSM 5159]|uniref:Uncharacterized protein n=1 Tax=Thermomicrobium roseum (strain ATCC 27502 / DSM 5159 / P-2) TaxID=309801 RepID=B9KY50_THERP|nr:hypothetical protein trd_0393 [Thermomicrobium roseum DSM 5159]
MESALIVHRLPALFAARQPALRQVSRGSIKPRATLARSAACVFRIRHDRLTRGGSGSRVTP